MTRHFKRCPACAIDTKSQSTTYSNTYWCVFILEISLDHMVSIIKPNGALSTPIMSLNIGGWSGIINHAAMKLIFLRV